MTEFDYIVVGAGSAGCAVAARLAEDPNASVLLIEAGPKDFDPWLHVPAGYYKTIRNPRLTWQLETEPQPNLNNRTIKWPRGKVLGGSGAINGLIYVRGHPEDFNSWRASGNKGWGWDDVLPYFLKSESHENGGDQNHGASGPIRVGRAKDRRRICDAFIEAGKALGLPDTDDFNAGYQDGVGYYQFTASGYWRSSPAAYLRQTKRRNLTIRTGCQTRRILTQRKCATGVEIQSKSGTVEKLLARREVVISCGSIGTPQLLQLSGIGPAAVLKRANVPVVHDLPGVGANLIDRLQVRSVFRCSEPITINDVYGSPVKKGIAGAKYALTKSGPLTIGAGQAAAFLRTDPGLKRPDLELTFMAFSTPGPGQMPHDFPGFTILGYPLQPRSRGTIQISSADPYQPPRISPDYLSDTYDQEMLIQALDTCREFADQPSLKELIVEEHMPGTQVQTRDEKLAYIRDNATTVFHCVGTCRMGPDTQVDAAVNDRLKVHGMEGLRVADASIMPNVISGNTNATTMMIGEKAAAMIHEDWRA